MAGAPNDPNQPPPKPPPAPPPPAQAPLPSPGSQLIPPQPLPPVDPILVDSGESLIVDSTGDGESLPPGFRDFKTMVEDEDGPMPPSASARVGSLGAVPPSARFPSAPSATPSDRLSSASQGPSLGRAQSFDPVDDGPPGTRTGSGGGGGPFASNPRGSAPPGPSRPSSGSARPGTGRPTVAAPTAKQDGSVYGSAVGSAGEATGDDVELQVGTIFEVRPGLKLILEKVLGKGGMGVVYLVHDPKMGRRLALKLIRGRHSSARVMRFTRETNVTARLNHPGIPPVNEAGATVKGINYMLMRYVEGESLKRRLRRMWGGGGKPDPEQIRELLQALVRMGEAVSYAHNQQVIHRDLKPENIMIGSYGEVYVMDWGLARNLDESAMDDVSIAEALSAKNEPDPKDSDAVAGGLTRAGATLGTVGYMPPEQARGEPIDHRADIFSLGVILTRILTGRSALGDAPQDRLEKTMADEVLTPIDIDPNVSPELNAIAAKATAPNRLDRYDEAEAFVDDVQAYLEGRKVSAYNYRRRDELMRFIKSYPAVSVGVVALILLMIVLFSVQRQIDENKRIAEAEKTRLEQQQAAERIEAEKRAFEERRALEDKQARERRELEARRAAEKKAMEEKIAADKRAAEEQRAKEVQSYINSGLGALDKEDPKHALEEFNKALALDPISVQAKLGKREAEKAIAQALESERDALAKRRDRLKAERYEKDAEAALERKDFKAALEATDLAVAFGSTKGKQIREKALEGRAAELSAEKAAEFRRRAAEMVEVAKALDDEGNPQEAMRAYHQALAFDGKNADASAGLQAIHQRLAQFEAQEERRKRQEESFEKVKVARKILEDGKQSYLRGESTLVVLDLHVEGLEAADKALFLHPASEAARQVKKELGQQLAAILRQEGHSQFEADFVLRFSGTEPGSNYAKIPRDPHLEIREGDAVRIRQALGTTRFKRHTIFNTLRSYVAKTFPNHRVIIVVRSKPVSGDPIPKIQLTGLWVQVEDKIARTVRPPYKIPIDGEYVRPMTTDKLGRIIGTFDESRTQSLIDGKYWAKKVGDIARKLLRDAAK